MYVELETPPAWTAEAEFSIIRGVLEVLEVKGLDVIDAEIIKYATPKMLVSITLVPRYMGRAGYIIAEALGEDNPPGGVIQVVADNNDDGHIEINVGILSLRMEMAVVHHLPAGLPGWASKWWSE